MEKRPFEKTEVAHLVKGFKVSYVTGRFVTLLTTARY